MILLDLASFICGKVNQSEAEDLSACKGFLRQRRDMIWADQLWKDSLVEYTQTLSAAGYLVTSTWLPTKKVMLQPACIERVIAVRTGVRKLNVESSDIFYRTDFDSFASQGDAYQFRNLPACVWDFDAATRLQLLAANAADVSPAISDVVGADGVTQQRISAGLGNFDFGSVWTVLTLQKRATQGAVSLATALLITNNFPIAMDFTWLPTAGTASAGVLTIASGGSALMTVPQGANPFIGAYQSGFAGVADFAVNVGLSFAGTVTLNVDGSFSTGAGGTILTMAAADLVTPRRQRIQLIGAVPDPTTIRVLAKSKAPTFTDDGDEPGLTGVENVLLSMAQGDMLQRERQYGKAQLCFQEGMALLEQLKKQEVVQQAHNKRIMPEDGYGNPYDLYGHAPLSF